VGISPTWVPFAPYASSTADARPSRDGRKFVFVEGSSGTKSALSLDMSVRAAWCAEAQVTITCPWGEVRHEEVVLRAAPSLPELRSVRLGLSCGGRRLPLTGALEIGVHGEGFPQLGSVFAPGLYVMFENGVAVDPIRLPRQAHHVKVVAGVSASTYYLNGAAHPWHAVPEASGAADPESLEIELIAAPVELRVVDREGRRWRGFDLHVKPDGPPRQKPRGWMLRWDQVWDGRYRGIDRPPICWVSKGRSMLRVGYPGVGKGEAPVEILDGCAARSVELLLTGSYTGRGGHR
jgi:hypothetical protein